MVHGIGGEEGQCPTAADPGTPDEKVSFFAFEPNVTAGTHGNQRNPSKQSEAKHQQNNAYLGEQVHAKHFFKWKLGTEPISDAWTLRFRLIVRKARSLRLRAETYRLRWRMYDRRWYDRMGSKNLRCPWFWEYWRWHCQMRRIERRCGGFRNRYGNRIGGRSRSRNRLRRPVRLRGRRHHGNRLYRLRHIKHSIGLGIVCRRFLLRGNWLCRGRLSLGFDRRDVLSRQLVDRACQGAPKSSDFAPEIGFSALVLQMSLIKEPSEIPRPDPVT